MAFRLLMTVMISFSLRCNCDGVGYTMGKNYPNISTITQLMPQNGKDNMSSITFFTSIYIKDSKDFSDDHSTYSYVTEYNNQ
jgi:hypothetical protein